MTGAVINHPMILCGHSCGISACRSLVTRVDSICIEILGPSSDWSGLVVKQKGMKTKINENIAFL